MMKTLLAACLLFPSPALAENWELRGDVQAELRIYPDSAINPGQKDTALSNSFAVRPELSYEWNEGNDRVLFTPFFRVDSQDKNRTHFDLREANWLHLGDKWSILVGLEKVFWGVTESRHLVNVINQVDGVEDLDGEDSLGQPMINLTVEKSWGVLDLFYLPFFRKRTFPSEEARLRGSLPISDTAHYESSAEEFHQDTAMRYTNTLGEFDLGVGFFYGTGREPRLFVEKDTVGKLFLRPHYDIINVVRSESFILAMGRICRCEEKI